MVKFPFFKNILDFVLFKENAKNNKNNIVFEQYKMAIETANEITNSRYKFNRFMIMICTALIAAIGTLCKYNNVIYTIPIVFIGIFISFVWIKQLNCFKIMIKIKYESVKKIEKENTDILEIFNKEDAKRENYKKYGNFKSFSEQEKMIANIFKGGFIGYLILITFVMFFKALAFLLCNINILNYYIVMYLN